MRVRGILRLVVVTAGVLALAGSATAQPAPTGPGPDGQVNLQRRVQLTPQDELAQGDVIIKRMETSSGVIRKMLEKAREDRDVVKTLCLNDKLSQVDVSTRSARERQTALQAAVQRRDGELAGHEFTILTVLRQRSEQLTAEANQCIGQEVSFVAQTQVVTDVDPNIPGEDTSNFPPVDPALISGPPVCISCTGR